MSRAYPDTLGAAGLPAFTPQTNSSGQGITIDGLTPAYNISYGYHRNIVLAIVSNGQLMQMPRGIGMIGPVTQACNAAGHPGNGNPYIVDDQQAYQLHNHDHSFIFHAEPTSAMGTFTLGQLFDVWKQPLSATQAANQIGTVRVFTYSADAASPVATEYIGNPYNAPFATANDNVTIVEVGTFVPLPRFTIDPNYSSFSCS